MSSADAVEDHGQRGDHYQSQIAQFVGYSQIVGASWHAWSDRYAAADPDHQINLGLMQCDDPDHGYEAGQRWDELDDRIAATNCAIEEVIAGATGL